MLNDVRTYFSTLDHYEPFPNYRGSVAAENA